MRREYERKSHGIGIRKFEFSEIQKFLNSKSKDNRKLKNREFEFWKWYKYEYSKIRKVKKF